MLWGLAGAALGCLSFAKWAGADCSPPEWRVQLTSVTASDGTTEHQMYWPTSARLTSYDGHAHITASPAPSAGSVARVGADR